MKSYLSTLLGLLIMMSSVFVDAQTFVNQDWVSISGQPDLNNFPVAGWEEVDWTGSTLDGFNNLIVTGNTLVESGNTEILTTKYNENGEIVWQKTYGGAANSYDYGIDVTTDAQGNVYVAGTITEQSSLLDICVLKYSISGQLEWAKTWNGSTNLYDIPTKIKVDNQGNVFLAGQTMGSITDTDMVLIKYSNNSTLLWESSYDYAGLFELTTGLQIDEPNQQVSITGFSSPSSGNWDYANIKYDFSIGNLQSAVRTEIQSIDINEKTVIAHDNGNVFISGSTNSLTNKDIQTIKINESGEIEWSNVFDGEALDDIPTSIGVNEAGVVYVTGTSSKNDGGSDIITIKLDETGEYLWSHRFLSIEEP